MTLIQYQKLVALEERLGDPFDPGNGFSFEAAVEMDETEAYPESACEMLNEWGLHGYYVPVNLGGTFTSFEELLHLTRGVARRDLTVAIAHGKTYLGAIAVWMAGSAEQQTRLARIILDGAQTALGLTEQAHGSDLLASDVKLRRVDDGFRLYGTKWLINNATRGRALTIFARSDPAGGPRGFTLVLLDKADCDEASLRPLPKIKTHGIRGADISGIQFDGQPIPPDAAVGEMGSGLEIVLKALQVTRTLCAGLSLGAADTALRITLDFARQRRLYNARVFDLPYPRELLLECFLDLLACDCAAIGGARALHAAPEQMSVWSAVIKTFVPLTIERMIQRLSVVLGARFYLRESFCHGLFQKILRDNAIVGLFDSSSAVNLELIALQLRQRLREGRTDAVRASARESLDAIFNLECPLPPCRYKAFSLSCSGADPVLSTLPDLSDEIAACSDLTPPVRDALNLLLRKLQDIRATLSSELEAKVRIKLPSRRPPAQQFRLAQRYAALHTAASCLHLWLRSRQHFSPFFQDGIWLVLCLRRLLESQSLHLDESAMSVWKEMTLDELLRLHEDNYLFSVVPIALAARTQRDFDAPGV